MGSDWLRLLASPAAAGRKSAAQAESLSVMIWPMPAESCGMQLVAFNLQPSLQHLKHAPCHTYSQQTPSCYAGNNYESSAWQHNTLTKRCAERMQVSAPRITWLSSAAYRSTAWSQLNPACNCTVLQLLMLHCKCIAADMLQTASPQQTQR
jgi:hypothetical protein